jgi:hypothetical protein
MITPVELLPRDLIHNGMSLTQLYRSAREGGNIVYLQNSEPGIAHGHKFHTFKINVVNGVEQLGQLLATTSSTDHAISIAAQAQS